MNTLRMQRSSVSVAASRPSTTSQRRAALVVRRAEPEKAPAAGTIFYAGKTYTESEYAAAISSGAIVAQPSVTPMPGVAAVAVQPTFNEVMGFSGSPEIINGRLAMLGFVAAVGAELSSGETVLKQVSDEPTGIAIVFLLFIAASLVPAFQRSTKSMGPFTAGAEMTNGRAAMIGFASLLVLEAVRGVALLG
mmetsp:Transcript_7223/g.12437  ORF Transcript_7223/g.12437 Transcript_7223/m.12437 type:complete len:192 (-) Transcript_7223:211-786(-)